MTAHLRRHPRFVTAQEVEVELADRRDLQQLWTLDISKGGLFIQCEAPPANGTELEVRLSTPDGTLALRARVVHVVDAVTARTLGQTSGVGLQFIDLSKELRTKIERYVDGLESRLTADLVARDETAEPLEDLLEQARAVNAAISASDLYGALGVDPGASNAAIQERVAELCNKFAHPPADTSPPKMARLKQVASQIDRAAALFANPLRRLHFDFNHGFVRVDERRAAGEDLEHLRAVWFEAFPEKVAKARELARAAIGCVESDRLKEGADLAKQAIELDPFNEDLRSAEEQWRGGKSAAARPQDPGQQAPVVDVSQIMQELLQLQSGLKKMGDRQILGLNEKATTQDIDRAYRERSSRYDPLALRGQVPPSVLKIADDVKRRLELAYKTLSMRQRPPQQAVEAVDESDPATKNEMGVVFLRKQNYVKARELFKEAMTRAPANAEYKANYAWSMIVDASFDRREAMKLAQPLLEQAIDKAPSFQSLDKKKLARYHFYLGRLLREQGKLVSAKERFESAVELDAGLTEAATELRLIEARTKKG